ncbi:MAG: DUF3575 domain-containing protein, partial [Bacteroidales bacterium]|nr:DUF3575 domain-containing protein [Bacteroidales bacterium]
GDEPIPLIERFAFKTNALEWLATIPNFTVAFDVFPSKYNHEVALLGVKYNWDTWHQYAPYIVFNAFDIRPEFRHYYRQTQRGQLDDGSWKAVPFFSREKKNPKEWRAYYVGAYLDFTSYSFKLTDTGRQGWAAGLGLSVGYEIPLYEYRHGAVDLDLGFSAGLIVTANKAYTLLDSDPFAYARVPDKDVNFLPLPMVSEVRAVFSWRSKSVRDKYNKDDPQEKFYQDEKSNIDRDLAGSTKAEFDNNASMQKKIKYAQSDSLYRADYMAMLDEMHRDRESRIDPRLSEKYRRKLKKYIQDGCNRLLKEFDSELHSSSKEKLDADKAAAKEAEKAAKEAEKAEKKAAKEAEKAEKKAAKEAEKAAKEAAKQAAKEAKAAEKQVKEDDTNKEAE